MYRVEEETTEAVFHEALSMARDHYYEVESKSDKVGFKLDLSLMKEYVAHGLLYVITARTEQGELVGYFANMIAPDPITSRPVGREFGVYVKPSHRGTTVFPQMLQEVEEMALKKGAYSQLLMFKEGHDKGSIGDLGYGPTEQVYQKLLGE